MKDYEKLLKELHTALISEKTPYRKRLLKDKIESLRTEYENIKKPAIEIKNKQENIKIPHENEINSNKVIIKNETNTKHALSECSVLHVENSEHIKVSIGNADTLCLINVNDSEIVGTFEQTRLFGCRNIFLKIWTKTPVTIEKCVGIKISSNGNSNNNQFDKVCDFSDPIGNKNYTIIK